MERRNIPENRLRGYEKGTALREKFYIRRERGYGTFGSTLSLPRDRLFCDGVVLVPSMKVCQSIGMPL